MRTNTPFLPTSREEMRARGWQDYDFLLVSGDAYVDHPSFGAAVISRVLEAEGFRVAVLAQPAWSGTTAFTAMGAPRLAVMIAGGNIDSMVAHYTAAKKRRTGDSYSPGGKSGNRPDRATLVYAQLAQRAFPDVPVVLGGLEASLRRFAHYDYWDDVVRPSLLIESGASLLVYGMGERAVREIARRLDRGHPAGKLTDIPGTCCRIPAKPDGGSPCEGLSCASYEKISRDKRAYAETTALQYDEQDPIRGRALYQRHGDVFLVQNPPALPLDGTELDFVAELPYARAWHPDYDARGGVPALEEVKFSLAHNRGCFGGCHFCSLAFHQGRMVTARTEASLLREAERLAGEPDFKGYIHDVGGPTANFRHPSCRKQRTQGLCRKKNCLTPTPCPNLDADHGAYTRLLRRLREIPGVKKVFVRSGLRYDYALQDKSGEFLGELVRHHVSGQLKVAPEHCMNNVLDAMGKPHWDTFVRFAEHFTALSKKAKLEQYLVFYLMSSHPGCTLEDAVRLAETLRDMGKQPEQVQDFYPTPGTLSTCMYYTGLDPRTLKPVYVARTPREKAMQRALLQWRRPENRPLVLEALWETGRDPDFFFGALKPRNPGKSSAPTPLRDAPSYKTRDNAAKKGASARSKPPSGGKKGPKIPAAGKPPGKRRP